MLKLAILAFFLATAVHAQSAAHSKIYQVQSASHLSPLQGQLVDVTGIVTAIASNGFYLQDPVGDNNRVTSDAVFVFTGSTPSVDVGDDASVTGTVNDFFPGGLSSRNLPTTQIVATDLANVVVLSSGNALPTPVILGSGGRTPPKASIDNDNRTFFEPSEDGLDFFESLEGMLVTVRDPVTISTRNRFGELWVLADRGIDSGLSSRGVLPIAKGDFNPERIQIDPDSSVFKTDTPDLPIGTALADVTGVFSYNFGNFEIIPTAPVKVTKNSTLQPTATDLRSSSNRATIATVNALNIDPNGGAEKFAALASIIVTNLGAPDVVALQEVQDENGPAKEGTVSASLTLQLIVDAIRKVSACVSAGCPTYSHVDNTFIGRDTSGGQPFGNIRTAFLFRNDRIAIMPNSVNSVVNATDQQSNTNNRFFNSRLPLAVGFTHLPSGVTFEVINVHLSSKGGSAPMFGVEQPFPKRQEDTSVNGAVDERRAQAESIRDYIAAKPMAERSRIVVTGDFNEFEFVSPLKTLEQEVTLLTRKIPRKERYTFIFQGNAQVLDHFFVGSAFANTALVEIVHVNVEFPAKQAASDHDPVVVQLRMK